LLIAVIAAVRAGELDELLPQQSKVKDVPKSKRADKINPEHRRPRRSGFWDSTGRERSLLAGRLLSSRCATKLHRFRCSFFTTASAKSNSADDQSQCNNVLHVIFPVESFRYGVNLTRSLARKHVAGAAKSRFANWRCCADTVSNVVSLTFGRALPTRSRLLKTLPVYR